jgi:hypothetical protein
MSRVDELVEQYLTKLRRELADLPSARREEIVDEISGHIDEARAAGAADNEVDALNMLERLGEPAEIAAEARARFGIESPQPNTRDTWAVIMLSAGSLLVPLLGWLIGVYLLWESRVWTVREKLAGTLLPPGGFACSIFFLQRLIAPADEGTGIEGFLALGVGVLPFLTYGYLGWQLRRRNQLARARDSAVSV